MESLPASLSWSTLNEPGNIPGMNSLLPDDIDELKRLLAEQEALNRALLEKLNEREREIDHLQAQLDKLRRMNFCQRQDLWPFFAIFNVRYLITSVVRFPPFHHH